MVAGAKTVLWFLLGLSDVQSANHVPDVTASKPSAHMTLQIDAANHSIRILEQTNVSVNLEAAEAQDLQISKALQIECELQQDGHLFTISAYADSKYHLIPIDVVSYKSYDPAFIKLQLDELYLTNNISTFDAAVHTVHIDFYAHD